MANRYETNLILERIADGLNDDQNSALIDALTTIANAISQGGGGDIPSGGTMGQLLGKRSNQDFDLTWYDNMGDDALSNQASEYNPQSNYVVGDYCLHMNYLYVCISPTTGNWDSTCWNRVQFGSQISALNSKITANVTDADIDISGYTSSYYTCPKDGYLYLAVGASANFIYMYIRGTSSGNTFTFSTTGSSNALFMRKGMQCRVVTNTGSNNTIKFIGLS